MIETVAHLQDLRTRVAGWKRAGLRVGFVPTMGNLHSGHFSLVELARAHADRVVASVFVNPTQFGPSEDYARYPRTPEQDARGLEAAGCDLLWLPSVETMYPYGPDAAVRMRVPGITDVLDGAHRPGHFDGVATVVAKLLNQAGADFAMFGEKDYQQLLTVRRMAADLDIATEIVGVPTVREADGLALSSRNAYLSAEERARAALFPKTLMAARDAIRAGAPVEAALAEADAALRAAGLVPDYVALRDAETLAPVASLERPARILSAVRVGSTRLIDNLAVETV